MARAPFLLAAPLVAALTATTAFAQDEVPPVVPDQGEALTEESRTVDPATFDSFEDWLAPRAPIPAVERGGFLAREMLDRALRARNGDRVGEIVNIALDAEARARFFLVRMGDDGIRAVPVASVIVDDEDRLFTELTPAQVEELPRIGG